MSKSEPQLTEQQAYLAMCAFLETYYAQTGASDVGALLGSMAHLPDGSPADPALASEWKQSVQAGLSGQVGSALQFHQGGPKSAA